MPDVVAMPPTSETDSWLSTPMAVALAVVFGAATLIGISVPSESDGREICALVLTLIYAIYLGFVFTRGGVAELAVEGSFLTVGLIFVGLGLWGDPGWLAAGLLLHGVWDLLHYRDRQMFGVRGVPGWYVPACAAYDWIVGVGVLVILR